MRKAFTLIELLIVIAIIAILALIAIPNFLEAQTRAKVARVKSDMRTVATALEAYFVDANTYPPIHTDQRVDNYRAWCNYLSESIGSTNNRALMLTTPIAYMTSFTIDPFLENGDMQMSTKDASYLFVNILGAYRRYMANPTTWDTANSYSFNAPSDKLCFNNSSATAIKSRTYDVSWMLLSPGPSRNTGVRKLFGGGTCKMDPGLMKKNNWAVVQIGCVPTYDPTNGTVSDGPIIRVNGTGEVH